ncbi:MULTISPECIES: hypothetical protein [Pseudomonas]|uniref:hypothetical protein n=1 Tax=Pseudomonas TaxID=286 RepID=UPI0015AAD9A9|nr:MULTISPECIES: hypothetical protein [Pseudomonas]MDW3714935.1 hypothetical protein [Pseudomonas sp. 2023EL-01195]
MIDLTERYRESLMINASASAASTTHLSSLAITPSLMSWNAGGNRRSLSVRLKAFHGISYNMKNQFTVTIGKLWALHPASERRCKSDLHQSHPDYFHPTNRAGVARALSPPAAKL